MGRRKNKRRKARVKRPDTVTNGAPAVREKERVMVGVPCVGDYLHLGVVAFLQALGEATSNPKCPWAFSWTIKTGLRPVEYARNRIAGEFMRSKAERLWMIDHDMIPAENAFELLHVPGDIVCASALAYKRNHETNEPRLEVCAFKFNTNGDNKFNSIVPKPGAALIDIDGAGTGSILIHRRVFEDERMKLGTEYDWYGPHTTDEEEGDDYAPPYFRTQYAPNGRILRGEDLDFCLRAKECGYVLRLHAGVDFGHCKEVNLTDVAKMAHSAAQKVRANGNGQSEMHRQEAPELRERHRSRFSDVGDVRRILDAARPLQSGEGRGQAEAAQSRRDAPEA